MTARCGGVGRTLRRAAARLLLVSLAALAAAACGRTEPEAVRVEAVSHDDAGGRVDLAEDAAAVGVIDVQAVVAHAQARAKDLKALAAAERDHAQRVERLRVKAREGGIRLDEFLGQILARTQLVKQRLPVGCCVPLSLRQLAETDAPAGILRLERDAVITAHKGVKGRKIALRQVQPAAADKLREIFQECYLTLEIRLGGAVVRAHEQRRLHVGSRERAFPP